MAQKRCVLWRSAGKGKWEKLYGVLDAKGKIVAVQSYKRSHRQDLQRSSASEREKRGSRG